MMVVKRRPVRHAGTGAADAAPAGPSSISWCAQGYDNFDFKRISRALIDFANIELSAFYFDVRKDALYCDAPSSLRRRASLQVIRTIFDCLVTWLAPMLPFTMEEAWLDRKPDAALGASRAVSRGSRRMAR
jgi:isoleucyl-tRNA synthetase